METSKDCVTPSLLFFEMKQLILHLLISEYLNLVNRMMKFFIFYNFSNLRSYYIEVWKQMRIALNVCKSISNLVICLLGSQYPGFTLDYTYSISHQNK